MAGPHPLYQSLVRLYPRDFRREYGEDLVTHHADLVADRGARAAWARSALDLTITLPRYHLENVMTEKHGAQTLGIVIGLLGVAGLAGVLTGLYPAIVFFVVAVALAVAQRSKLAGALRVPNSNLRRRRLVTAAVLGAIFVVSYGIYMMVIGDTWTVRETVLASVGTLAMFGAPGFLIAGLLTPRSPDHGAVAPAG